MPVGTLARTVRQQGWRQVLAWRQALAEVQVQQQQPGMQAQDAQQALYFGLPAVGGQFDSLHGSGRPGWFAAFSAITASCSPGAAGASADGVAALPAGGWCQLQLRGFSLRSGHWRPRHKDVMPDRNLPHKNEEILAREVRVLFPAGEEKAAEVMPTKQAINLARGQGLDVVMVSPKVDPPVVRLVEWSKVLYEAQKREKVATKQRLAAQRAVQAREVRIGCQIAEHDLAIKMAQARRFLEESSLLRLVVTFRGVQQIALGRDVTLYLIGQLADICTVRDEKQLQRPLKGQWAVVLTPNPPIISPKAPAKVKQQQQDQTAEQQHAVPQAAEPQAAEKQVAAQQQ